MAAIVVVVDSDEAERRVLSATLAADGFSVVQVESAVEGMVQVLEPKVGLVVIASETGPMRIEELLPVFRRLTAAPLLVIGPGGGPREGSALERGADFYLSRPFRPSELAVRSRVLVRRSTEPEAPERWGPSEGLLMTTGTASDAA